MGIFTTDTKNLKELYEDLLHKTLNSERQLVKEGLPAMVEKATAADLKSAFEKHLEETRIHVSRLERILDALEGEDNESKCKTTAAMISETSSAAADAKDLQLRDVLLIASGNQVEHYEIAVYGTLKTWAIVLGESEDAEVLQRTLEEEKAANETLTRLSSQINLHAPMTSA
jgi:ferritin-like metal-binding protein YciE